MSTRAVPFGIAASVPGILAALVLALPPAAVAAPSGTSTAVFQCSTRDGRTVFSDEPCVGAPQVRVWTPRAGAQGIERSTPAAPAPIAPAATLAATMGHSTNAGATDYGPYVDCQRRGGRFDVAARICHLPDDAARRMFDAK